MAKILSHKRSDARSEGEGQIRHIMDRLSKAVQSRDIEGILATYAEDATVFDVRDSLLYGKDGLRSSWEECFMSSKEFNIEISEPTIKTEGNLAFSHCLSHATGKTTDGENIDVWMRATDCYRKAGGKWLIVHEHVSCPGDFVSGKILQNLEPSSSE
jgi:uncharacterized protein (TIGR02246 family)